MTGRRDLSDWILAALAAALVLGFVVYALPSLLSIYRGTYRMMAMPDGAQVTFTSDIIGMVELAGRHGQAIGVSGYAYDRRRPDFPVEIIVFFRGTQIGSSVTDRERPELSRGQAVDLRTPGFLVQFPADLVPADAEEPVRVFAVSAETQARELFKGARRVNVVDDAAPKPAK
jgi:hypothetical protein